MNNIELANKALAVWADREHWSYVQGGLGELSNSDRIRNLYTYYRRVGKNSMTCDYNVWLPTFGMAKDGNAKHCTDCSNFIQYLLGSGKNAAASHYTNMRDAGDIFVAPVGTILLIPGAHVGIVVTQGVRNNDGTWKVQPESVDFYAYNNTCRKVCYVNGAFSKAVYLTGIDYVTKPSTDGAKAVKIEAAVVNKTRHINDVLTASDFNIKVTMSNGTVLNNPAGWYANPLRLGATKNNITVGYQNVSTVVEVDAIDSRKPVKLEASVEGSFMVGDTLQAKDFTIKVTMSNGDIVMNPNGWGANPLKLTSTTNVITVVYSGLKTTTTVKAKSTSPYTDVKPTDWFYSDVMYMYDTGIMTGVTDTTFAPNDNIKRCDVCVMVYRDAGVNASVGQQFPDVPNGKYYSNPVNWCKISKIVTGKKDGNFYPKESIIRQDFIKILYEYAVFKKYDVSVKSPISYKKAPDASDVSLYAAPMVNWGYENGFIGNGSNIKPKENLTRAEAATMFARFMRKYK